jgi:hypothetical protein
MLNKANLKSSYTIRFSFYDILEITKLQRWRLDQYSSKERDKDGEGIVNMEKIAE